MQLILHDTAQRMRQFYALTKPRVTMLAVFCAVIGMFLATPGMVPWRVLFSGDGRHRAGGGRGFRDQLPDRAARSTPRWRAPAGARCRAVS